MCCQKKFCSRFFRVMAGDQNREGVYGGDLNVVMALPPIAGIYKTCYCIFSCVIGLLPKGSFWFHLYVGLHLYIHIPQAYSMRWKAPTHGSLADIKRGKEEAELRMSFDQDLRSSKSRRRIRERILYAIMYMKPSCDFPRSPMHIQTSPNSQIHGVEILFPDSFFLLRISDVSGVSNQFIVKVLRR